MAELLTYLTRLHETPRYYGSGLYRQLNEKKIFLWSQAIAFKVLITVVPMIMLATGILASGVLGPILEEEESFSTVAAFIQNFLPPDQSDQLITFLRDFAGAGNTLTLIGGLALLLSALTLFTTLRVVVGNLFQEDWHEDRSILGGYLFDLRMVGQVGLLFLLSLGLTVAVQTLDATVFKLISQVGLQFMREWIVTMLALLVPFLITTAMFFQLFYFVPKPHPPPLSTLFGAFFSAILWEAAKSAFTLFAQYAGRFDRYSGDGAEGVLGSTFGLIIAFVFWVYYSGIVLCLGGIMVLLHEKRHRSRRLATLTNADEDLADETASSRETPEPDDIRTVTTGDQRPSQPAPPSKTSEDLSVN